MIQKSLLTIVFAGLTTVTLLAQVSVTTKVPPTVKPGGEFNVELNISKGDVTGFAKLQQDLPTGFTAMPGESANSTFSFKDRKVKFLWMALPSTTDIKVSYKVVVDASVSGNQIMEGNFSFIRNNETEKFVLPKDIIVVSSEPTAASQSVVAANQAMEDQKRKDEAASSARAEAQAEETAKPAESTNSQEASNTAAESTSTQESSSQPASSTSAADAQVAEEKRATEVKKSQDAKAAADQEAQRKQAEQAKAQESKPVVKSQPARASSSASELKSKPGLVFRVQIAAGPKSTESALFASKHNISDAISVENHEGLSKYVVGEFGSYRPAKTYSNELRDTNGVAGPFVTAYNNGVRITVQEALNIAGQ
jgi:septal ring-binding cell division protein DamX